MRFLRIDDLKRHVRSVHKCDLTEEGGLKPREPKPGEAMHPSTSTHAGSLLETRAPRGPSGGITVAVAVAAVGTSTSASASAILRTPGLRAPPIVIPPSIVPPPSWRPGGSSSSGPGGGPGGGLGGGGVSRERAREREGRGAGVVAMAVERERPMSAESARSGGSDRFGMALSLRGETPPSPMDTRED
jgi:hypothetical protein